jgi:hypothetical protein
VLCITQNWAARVGSGYLRHLAVVEILESKHREYAGMSSRARPATAA